VEVRWELFSPELNFRIWMRNDLAQRFSICTRIWRLIKSDTSIANGTYTHDLSKTVGIIEGFKFLLKLRFLLGILIKDKYLTQNTDPRDLIGQRPWLKTLIIKCENWENDVRNKRLELEAIIPIFKVNYCDYYPDFRFKKLNHHYPDWCSKRSIIWLLNNNGHLVFKIKSLFYYTT
jgi:hypothetical protein